MKFVPIGPIDNIPAFIQIIAWRRTGDKSLSDILGCHANMRHSASMSYCVPINLHTYALVWFSTSGFYPFPSGLFHWHWGNHEIGPVPVMQS